MRGQDDAHHGTAEARNSRRRDPQLDGADGLIIRLDIADHMRECASVDTSRAGGIQAENEVVREHENLAAGRHRDQRTRGHFGLVGEGDCPPVSRFDSGLPSQMGEPNRVLNGVLDGVRGHAAGYGRHVLGLAVDVVAGELVRGVCGGIRDRVTWGGTGPMSVLAQGVFPPLVCGN